MSLDWTTFANTPPRSPKTSSTTGLQSNTTSLPTSPVLIESYIPESDAPDFSPSSKEAAEDLFQSNFLLSDDPYIGDWAFHDAFDLIDNADMSFPYTKSASQDTWASPDLSGVDSRPLDLDSLTTAASDQSLVVDSVNGEPPVNMGKRQKAPNDARAACWTSPLCPNHNKEGGPPNPSTCGGGCAPYLFDDSQRLEDWSDLPALSIEYPSPDTPLGEQQPSDLSAKPDESGRDEVTTSKKRVNNSASTSPSSPRAPLKQESSNASAEDEENNSKDITSTCKDRPRGRVPHNQVERKYRETLNSQLEALRKVVPELCKPARSHDGVDIEDLSAPNKPSKAVILASATTYIKQVEKEKKELLEENRLLRIRLKALQSLAKCDDCGLMQYVMDLKINGTK